MSVVKLTLQYFECFKTAAFFTVSKSKAGGEACAGCKCNYVKDVFSATWVEVNKSFSRWKTPVMID